MHVTRTRAGLAAVALTTLATLGLAAAPAGAETLSGFIPGDSLTVNASGTHGTLNGTAYNTNTTSYTGTAVPGAAVTLNAGTFTLGAGGTLSGGSEFTSDGLDVGLTTFSVGGTTNIPGGGTVVITGGSISGFDAVNVGGGVVTITGGNIQAPAVGGAGLVAQVNINNPTTGGTINLYGTNFLVDGLPAPAHLTVTTGTLTGLVSGTLANGDPLSTTYQLVGPGSTINFFAPAPEPSQNAALGLGVLGLAGLVLHARRRARA